MSLEEGFSPKSRRRLVAIAPALVLPIILVGMAGCTAGKLSSKQSKMEDGIVAAQHAALADAKSQAASGAPRPQGTSSPIPSLVQGEEHVRLREGGAPPATAPAGDKFDNNNADHLLARCRDRMARREWFDAIGDCRRSAQLNPASIEPQVLLMQLLVTMQSYSEAQATAEKVLVARPNDPVALYYLAWSHRGRDEFEEAIDALQRAIAADPKRVEFVEALAVTYRLSGNYGKSFETLEKALTMRPGDPKLEAMVNETRMELNEKLAPYYKLVKEKPESYDNQAALGFMLQKYGLPQKALTAYDMALTRIPTPFPQQATEAKKLAAQIYYNRGVVYRELGKPELAEPALWQAMQLDPTLASVAWYYTGLCRYDLGKYDTSIEALRRSIDLEPGVAENRSALADAYAKAGKADLAAEQRNAANGIRARADAEKAAEKDAEKAAAKVEAAKAAAPSPQPAVATAPSTATSVPAANAQP